LAIVVWFSINKFKEKKNNKWHGTLALREVIQRVLVAPVGMLMAPVTIMVAAQWVEAVVTE
jgi:hypothetical protein